MGNLYTQLKIFHFNEKLNSLPQSKDKILSPIHVRIKPTNACNHNCKYCAYRVEDLQLGQDMVIRDYIPKEKMLEIVDDLVEMGVKAVTFSGGGEPFVYPYLLETVKKLSETNIKFSSLTNGAMLKGEVAEIFARHGTWIRVSMDGWDDESYLDYRGVGGREFSKIMKNIEDFQKLGGKCFLGVSIIVDKKNSSHIYELVKKLKVIGVRTVKISPCIISNSGKENNEYHQTIFETVRNQISEAKTIQDEKFEIFDAYHTQLESFEKNYHWCPYLQILPIIGADSKIYSCQDKAYTAEGMIGSIEHQRFKDFWFSDKNKFFKVKPCIMCNHHCVADNKNKMIFEYLNTDKEHLEFV